MDHHPLLDYIIVGQGLAGSAVALQLLKRRKKILVIDVPTANSASRIAAGLFNPLTGRNNVKTWLADELFPFLHDFYNEAGELTRKRFFHPLNVYRPFTSVQDQNDWMGKSTDPAYAKFIEAVLLKPMSGRGIRDPFGGLLLKQSGYLDTGMYLQAIRDYIRSSGEVMDEHFDEKDLEMFPQVIQYRDRRARKIVFCQGASIVNSFLKDVPVIPLKGETLTIKTALPKHVIPNRGVYIVPGNTEDERRVGSTYNVADKIEGITEAARFEMEQKLKDVLALPYAVTGQNWGFRPTTPDRRPILGAHPNYEQIIIFNGLGTKGVSLAPYFSEMLVRWLENEDTLNKLVSVTRYK